MYVSGQIHTLIALPPEEGLPGIHQMVGWSQEPVRTLWKKRILSHTCLELSSDFSILLPAT
jgi:hypothetical protein